MKTLVFILISLAALPIFASPASELPEIVRCHQALDKVSEGLSEGLSVDKVTPIALAAGNKVFFLTQKSIYSVKKAPNQTMTVEIDDPPTPALYRKMDIQKDGSIGGVSYEEVQNKSSAVLATPALDDDILNLFKKELVARAKNLTSADMYDNANHPEDVIKALDACDKVQSPEFQQVVNKQIAYFQKKLSPGAPGQKNLPAQSR